MNTWYLITNSGDFQGNSLEEVKTSFLNRYDDRSSAPQIIGVECLNDDEEVLVKFCRQQILDLDQELSEQIYKNYQQACKDFAEQQQLSRVYEKI